MSLLTYLLVIGSVKTLSFSPRIRYSTSLYSSPDIVSNRAAYGIDRELQPGYKEDGDINPEENLQGYLPTPEPIPAKSKLDGSVMVSGYVRSKERTDQLVFDFLNAEESAFSFKKIIALVPDVKFAKKRLLSRSARYTGLLDKLDFLECELPTVEQLKGVQNWLVHLDAESEDLSTLNEIAEIASKSSDLVNLSVLLSNANELDVSAYTKAIKSFEEISSLQYTIVAVGRIEDHNEGSRPYKILDFGTEDSVIPADAVCSRDESMRLITESLALGNTARKALVVTECATDDVAAKLVKGLRQAGYSRSQEIDHMVMKGVKAYNEAIEEYKKKKFDKENPNPEEMRRIQEERDAQAKLDWEKTEKEFEEREKKEIEDHAKTWAKREYFRRSMGGNMGMTEEEFIKSVWERAMFEGDLKYRMMRGGNTDERKELAEFIKKQEVKKEAALKKAKAKLEESLGSDVFTKNQDDDTGKDDDSDD